MDNDKKIFLEAVKSQAIEGNPMTEEEIKFGLMLIEKGITGDAAIEAIIKDVFENAKKL